MPRCPVLGPLNGITVQTDQPYRSVGGLQRRCNLISVNIQASSKLSVFFGCLLRSFAILLPVSLAGCAEEDWKWGSQEKEEPATSLLFWPSPRTEEEAPAEDDLDFEPAPINEPAEGDVGEAEDTLEDAAFEPAFAATDPAPTEAEPASLQPNRIQFTDIRFDVLQARARRGAFSRSGKIWNHLDLESIPADTGALLHRNGFRVGRGTINSWPAIKAILESEREIQTSDNTTVLNNGRPLLLELDPRPRDQTMFLFRDDWSMPGATFADSINIIRVEYAVPPADADSLLVEIMPQIQLPAETPKFRRTAQGWERPVAIEPPSRILRELAFRMKLQPDEFVAIGPSPTIDEIEHLAGELFLCQEEQGRDYESIYFLTPRVIHRTGGFTTPFSTEPFAAEPQP